MVKVGQVVRVKVLEIDLKLKRVALSMRLGKAESSSPEMKESATQRSIAPSKDVEWVDLLELSSQANQPQHSDNEQLILPHSHAGVSGVHTNRHLEQPHSYQW